MSYDSNLDRLTVVDLRAIAADLKIAGRSKMKRAELLSAIDAAEIAARSVELFEQAAHIEEGIEQDEADAAEYATVSDQVAITKYSANEAFGTAVFEGRSIGGHATRERGRWVLRVEMGRTIRAKTLDKVARQWAKSLGFYATTIAIDTMS